MSVNHVNTPSVAAAVQRQPISCTHHVTFEQYLKERQWTIIAVPRDGLCFLNAIRLGLEKEKGLTLSLATVKEKLCEEVKSHLHDYTPYIVDYSNAHSGEAGDRGERLMYALHKYIDKGVYDTDVGDICITAMPNAIDAEIHIFEKSDQLTREFTAPPTHNDNEMKLGCVINLVRYAATKTEKEHFDLLTKEVGVTVLQKNSDPRAAMKRKEPSNSQSQSIMDMFIRRKSRKSSTGWSTCSSFIIIYYYYI